MQVFTARVTCCVPATSSGMLAAERLTRRARRPPGARVPGDARRGADRDGHGRSQGRRDQAAVHGARLPALPGAARARPPRLHRPSRACLERLQSKRPALQLLVPVPCWVPWRLAGHARGWYAHTTALAAALLVMFSGAAV